MKIVKAQLNTALIAFIDILGFRSKVKNIKIQNDFEEIYEKLTFIQKEFGRSTSKQKKKLNEFLGKKILAFSDCLIISMVFGSEFLKKLGSYDALMSELHLIGLSQSTCVCENIFLRGGIAIGQWYHNEDIIISPAFIEAYEIETNKATWPIIAFSEDTYKYFKAHPHRKRYARNSDPFKFIFGIYKTDENENVYFLDYLRIGYSDSDQKDDFLYCHKSSVINALMKSPDGIIRAKNEWLSEYHNKFVGSLGSQYKEYLIDMGQMR